MEIKIQQLTMQFKRHKVLDNFNLTLKEGVYGLLGPNGSGKTTLIRCMTNLYHPQAGNISFSDHKISANVDIGYLPQKFGIYRELKVFEALEYLAAVKDINMKESLLSIDTALERVGLLEVKANKIKTLSGGMIRRVGIAAALLGNPKILIFDEPTAGLDPEERRRFKNIINTCSQGKIVLLSTHILEDVESLCNQIVIIKKGEILFNGRREEVPNLAKDKVFEGTFIAENTEVISSYECDGHMVYRMLSDIKPEGASQVKAGIEDGYLYAIKRL